MWRVPGEHGHRLTEVFLVDSVPVEQLMNSDRRIWVMTAPRHLVLLWMLAAYVDLDRVSLREDRERWLREQLCNGRDLEAGLQGVRSWRDLCAWSGERAGILRTAKLVEGDPEHLQGTFRGETDPVRVERLTPDWFSAHIPKLLQGDFEEPMVHIPVASDLYDSELRDPDDPDDRQPGPWSELIRCDVPPPTTPEEAYARIYLLTAGPWVEARQSHSVEVWRADGLRVDPGDGAGPLFCCNLTRRAEDALGVLLLDHPTLVRLRTCLEAESSYYHMLAALQLGRQRPEPGWPLRQRVAQGLIPHLMDTHQLCGFVAHTFD